MRPATPTPAATPFGLWSFSAAAAPLSPQEAAGHLGETATVCGVVASAKYEANVQAQPTLLDLGKPSPKAVFTAVIYGDTRAKFGTPETSLRGKRIPAFLGPARLRPGTIGVALEGNHMSFLPKDIHRVGEILAFAAHTEIMPRFRRLTATQIREKSSQFDLVTDADEKAEAVIACRLKAAFPDAIVIGEEGAHKDPALLQAIATAELAFVVDPIDGTRNFTANLPLFGVMAAATVYGEVVAGVIYDPVCQDWAYAALGAGAWIEHEDGSRTTLRVAPSAPVSEMEGVIGTNFLAEPLRSTVNCNRSRLASSTWLRCAAHEYRMAAAGHCHLLFYNRLMPWDHAAGWLLHKEAGGYSAHFDGTAYHPTHFSGGLICAPDEASWRLARAALLER